MPDTETKSDTLLAYLLGGVGLLAISMVPLVSAFMMEVQLTGKLLLLAYWLLGALAISWAVRRFSKLGQRVVAVVAIVIGWYILLQVLMILTTMVFRF
ncbi:MAG: hypothetical protein EOO56_19515 [Hymenobacter sp.]|nr:MAG: hypothetical protein EOO56_19515 [Hymenobacter sp.]